MNDFTHRFTRQYMIPEIVLGVLFLVIPCVLEMSGLIELDYSRILGILSFFVAPFLIIASIFSYRIIRRFRKGSPDSGSGIANLLWYSVFSSVYIMIWMLKIQSSHDDGAFITDWAFVGIEIFLGLSVCWQIYWLVLLCRYVFFHASMKDCLKLMLKSIALAFVLFLLFNVLPLVIVLFLWPLLIMLICKIAFLFS